MGWLFMKIPQTIQIKGKSWKILRRWGLSLDGKKAWGLCDASNRTIILEQGLTRDEIFPVLLHEINHAIFHELHIQTVELGVEEIVVEGFKDVYLDLFSLRWKK